MKKPKAKRGKKFKHQETPLPANALGNDAGYDLDTLTRATEITKDAKRRKAAMTHAKTKVSLLSSVMSGPKPRDEGGMDRYARGRRKRIT